VLWSTCSYLYSLISAAHAIMVMMFCEVLVGGCVVSWSVWGQLAVFL
jgi:hypothetical protein